MPRKSGTFRFSLHDTTDVKDVPWLMALDALEEQGYTTEVVSFGKSSLIGYRCYRKDSNYCH